MEMIDQLVLDLIEKNLVTDQLVLNIGYDIMNLTDARRRREYTGPVTTDHFGRQVPKETHGSINLGRQISSAKIIVDAMMRLFDRIVNPGLLIRRINVVANHLVNESQVSEKSTPAQPDLFTDYEALEKQEAAERAELEKEKRLQQAILEIKKKLGKNAVLKGMNLLDGATAKERNEQIGGHRK